MKARMTVGGVALGLLLGSASFGSAPLTAQGPEGRWPLQPTSEIGRVVAPFLEGWYTNADGTFSYSFGYLNMNGDTVQIPIGERNKIEPARFDGMQPTLFLPGRHRGMFTVTVPAEMRDDDVWWTLTNDNGEVTRVPGRTMWAAYMLDHGPRPHGSVPPTVMFEGTPGEGLGPQGIISQRTVTATVGQPVELAVNVHDRSMRDTSDARFREPTDTRVIFTKYQGPAEGSVEFTRHPSTPVPEPPAAGRGGAGGGGGGGGRGGAQPGPNEVMVDAGQGTARVMATFSAPGEYMINAQADNWRVPDSSSGDQCCWTNGYIRVTVR
jgi:hypothetical protein